ncbi:hypothetical protein FRC03_007265 [Tulasnella sp. 419]|nr:hypothetical protein FRC03_007265 [Tulasnella sp. 419]
MLHFLILLHLERLNHISILQVLSWQVLLDPRHWTTSQRRSVHACQMAWLGSEVTSSTSRLSRIHIRSPSFSPLLPFITSKQPATNLLLGDFLEIRLCITLLKVRVEVESRIDMQLFSGFAGLFNMSTLLPVAILLKYVEWKMLEWSSGGKTRVVVATNMLITFDARDDSICGYGRCHISEHGNGWPIVVGSYVSSHQLRCYWS